VAASGRLAVRASVQLGRLYGRLFARIAHASVQLWVSVVELRLQAADIDDHLRVIAAAETFDGLLPVADTLITGIHRRSIEREASQIAIRGAEREAGDQALPGAVEVSILFCDLKDFTAFADRQGDGGSAVIDRFAKVVVLARIVTGNEPDRTCVCKKLAVIFLQALARECAHAMPTACTTPRWPHRRRTEAKQPRPVAGARPGVSRRIALDQRHAPAARACRRRAEHASADHDRRGMICRTSSHRSLGTAAHLSNNTIKEPAGGRSPDRFRPILR
jgi:hypothetical protein